MASFKITFSDTDGTRETYTVPYSFRATAEKYLKSDGFFIESVEAV